MKGKYMNDGDCLSVKQASIPVCPEMPSTSINRSPVKHKKDTKLFEREARKNSSFFEDYLLPQPSTAAEVPICGSPDNLIEENQPSTEEVLATVKFADEIQTDFVEQIDYRILCRFLGVPSVNDLKNHPFTDVPVITLMLMESTEKFMNSIGYEFAGELDFSDMGAPIPPTKNPWVIKGKELCFTIKGFQYYYKKGGKKGENIAFYFYSRLQDGLASITCFGTRLEFCKKIIVDLREYTKVHNCLRGTKLQDMDTISAKFKEVEIKEDHTWEHYYFAQEIKDLFDLEVFGFLENSEKYNDCGINKRGILLHGKPGTGKSTLGYLVCRYSGNYTVLWITPEILAENNSRLRLSIKTLYRLADYVAPCVVVLEDLDLIGQDRETGGDTMLLGALMNILDGVNSIKNAITIATTNRLAILEKALRNRPGRFDRVIEIPSMEKDLREKMLISRLREWKKSEGLIDYLVDKTDGWTPAEIQEFIHSSYLKLIASKKKKKYMDQHLAESVVENMKKFGVGSSVSSFGFNKKGD